MRNGLWMKGIVVGIIMLFIGTSVVPSIKGNLGEITKSDSNALNQISKESTNLNSNQNSPKTLGLTAGLVGYWSFDNRTWPGYDDSGNGNNGIGYGSTWTSAGKVHGALQFDGTNDYVGISNSASLNITNSISMSAWINLKSYNDINEYGSSIIHKCNSYHLFIYSDGHPGTNVVTPPMVNHFVKDEATTIQLNQWYFITSTYDGANIKIYINGEYKTQIPVNGSIQTDIINVSIGRREITNDCYFNGIIDEARIYDRTLTSTEIQDLYAQGSGNHPPNTPSNPSPVNNATGASIHAALSWTGGDPDASDTVTYDVYFGTSSPPALVSHNQSGTTYSPVKSSGTRYFWKIVAWDNHGASTTGPIWDFTTAGGGNHPPYTPSDPDPANHSTAISLNPILSWTGGDPDAGDTVTYDVYFGTDIPPALVSYNQSGTNYFPGEVDSGIRFWQIVAWDNHGASTTGPIWDFTALGGNNRPPNTPTITGPTEGTVGVATMYNFTATDPDGDQVYYFIDWGDTTNSSWIGLYSSGAQITQSHTWTTKGTYTIKAQAKDINDLKSDWATLSVTMPCSYDKPMPQFLELLFQRFPHAFPILRYLLG